MRFNAKVVVVLVAVISIELVQAKPPRSQCNGCENNSGGDQTGAIINQQDVSFKGDDITGIRLDQEEVKFRGGSRGGKTVGADINQIGVRFHGGSGKTTGIELNQKNVAFGDGSSECTSGCGQENNGSGSEDSNGSNGSDGSNDGIDDKRVRTQRPPRIQQSCADRPITFCGIFDGIPVHARDCSQPYQKCLPSNTIPPVSRNPQFPKGGNRPMRQPNGNGAPAPGQQSNGDSTQESQNGWESTNTNNVSSDEERHLSVTGKPPRAQQPSCGDRSMVICKFWDGVPVFAYDCDNPFQRCQPSNTRPTGSRKPQFPNGNHGLNRQPNGNGAPASGQQSNGDYTQESQNGWDSTHHHETNNHHGNRQSNCQSNRNDCQEQPPRQGNGNSNTHHGDQQSNCESSGNRCQQPPNRPQNPYDVDYRYPAYPGPHIDESFPYWQRPRPRSSSRQQVYDDGETLIASNGPGQFVAITNDGVITSNN